jgi:uncharacterized HhH-GPD family protein
VAAADPEALEAIFKEPPAIHRFPANMAKRVQAVAGALEDGYGGDPTRLWTGVGDAAELSKRVQGLPGFGEYKARIYLAVLSRNFDIRPQGWEELLPDWPNVSEIETASDREDLKLRKKAWKAQQG